MRVALVTGMADPWRDAVRTALYAHLTWWVNLLLLLMVGIAMAYVVLALVGPFIGIDVNTWLIGLPDVRLWLPDVRHW